MRRYNITTGSTTTVGGKVTSGCEGTSFNGEMISREGDRVACPACGTEGFIALTGPHLHEEWNGKQAALEGDLCICKCDPPPELIANQSSKSQEFGPQPQRVTPIVMRPTASASPPANYAAPVASNRAADACVFAKSCVSSFARMSPVNCVFMAYIPNLAVALTVCRLHKPGGMWTKARWWRCWMASASHGRRTMGRWSTRRVRIRVHRNVWIICSFIRLQWGKTRQSATTLAGKLTKLPGRIRSFRFLLTRVCRRCIWCLPSQWFTHWKLGHMTT